MSGRKKKEESPTTVDSHDDKRAQLSTLGSALRAKRKAMQLSIEQLAQLSDVSRSAISKIERGDVAPSTAVLSKLSEALSTSMAQLLSEEEEQDVIVMRAESQPVLVEAATGFQRRVLTPILPGRGIDWVMSTMPVGFHTGVFKGHKRGTEEYVYVLDGKMSVHLGAERHYLQSGDSIFFKATTGHAFENDGDTPCTYFLIMDNRQH
jgi:transcriptional regulator with XRE-family HTH domain